MSEFDVVTFGETMLRLTPPRLQRFEQASTVDVQVGGSESNTAVGLARLGLRVSWRSRLTDNPLGRLISSALRQQGVDIESVLWTKDDRVGLYFLEEGKSPRGSQVIYDRKGSAMARITPDDIPSNWFATDRATWFHTTGITAALSDSAAATALHCVRSAKNANWKVSFDVNYREKLWSVAQARSVCESFLNLADLIFIPSRDCARLFGFTNPEEAARQLASLYPQATIVVTCGIEGAVAHDGPSSSTRQSRLSPRLFHQPAFAAEPVGRLGGGDAFAAGFLARHIVTGDIAESLRWGSAAAAIKYSIPGDFPLLRPAEVAALAESHSSEEVRR